LPATKNKKSSQSIRAAIERFINAAFWDANKRVFWSDIRVLKKS
jgi:hypothetical protein